MKQAAITVLIFGVAYMSTLAQAQMYPAKPIRIVTSVAGGINDLVARVVGQGISGQMGQPVIVDNRGVVAFDLVANALPDGYTLLLHGPPFWMGPLLQKVSYDPAKNFVPVILVASSPNILVVHPTLAAKSVNELIALAKARPGNLNYASASSGGSTHLSMELFKSMAGVDIVHVPYKGSAPALNAVIGNEVPLMISTAGDVVPHIKAGRLRALGVTSAQPSRLLPELPPIATSLPGYEAINNTAVFAPAKTPVAIVRRLNGEIAAVLNNAEKKDQLFNAGVEVAGGTPEKLADVVKAEVSRMGKVIRDAGIRVQ